MLRLSLKDLSNVGEVFFGDVQIVEINSNWAVSVLSCADGS
jgi:hypothetical protein